METTSGMKGPTTLAVLASGLVLWGILVVLPSMHLQDLRGLHIVRLILLVGPLVVLVGGALLQNHLFLIVGFPCSMLPILVVWSDLVGARIYGPGAFIALVAATLTFLWVVLSKDTPPPAAKNISRAEASLADDDAECGPRLLRTQVAAHAVVMIALLYGVLFHRPTQAMIGEAYAGYEARATTLIGLVMFVAWVFALVRHLTVGLGRAVMAPDRYEAEQFRFESDALDEERVHTSLLWTVIVGLISGGALAAVLYLAN